MIKTTRKEFSHRILRGDRIKSSGGNAVKDIPGGRTYTTGRQGKAVPIAAEKKSLLDIMTLHQRLPVCQGNGITKKTMAFLQKQ